MDTGISETRSSSLEQPVLHHEISVEAKVGSESELRQLGATFEDEITPAPLPAQPSRKLTSSSLPVDAAQQPPSTGIVSGLFRNMFSSAATTPFHATLAQVRDHLINAAPRLSALNPLAAPSSPLLDNFLSYGETRGAASSGGGGGPGALGGDGAESARQSFTLRPGVTLPPSRPEAMRNLRVNGGAVVYMFIHPVSLDRIVICETTMEAFAWDGVKVLESRLAIEWSEKPEGGSRDRSATVGASESGDEVEGLRDDQTERSYCDLQSEPNSQAVSTRTRPRYDAVLLTHLGGHGNAHVVRATCATYIPNLDEVAVGHEDGRLRFYSCRTGAMGNQLRASAGDVQVSRITNQVIVPRCVDVLDQDKLVVGNDDGSVTIWRHKELSQPIGEVPAPSALVARRRSVAAGGRPPAVKAMVVVQPEEDEFVSSEDNDVERDLDKLSRVHQAGGSGFHGSVDALLEESRDQYLMVSFSDGTTWTAGLSGQPNGFSFSPHAGEIAQIVSIFQGTCLASIGADDRTLCVSAAISGRSLCRRLLPYRPTSLTPLAYAFRDAASIRNRPRRASSSDPSESVLVVGGAEGQVELFRVVVLSADCLEIRLLRRVSDRARGRRAEAALPHTVVFDRDESTLHCGTAGAGVRRWRLSEVDVEVVMLGRKDRQAEARWSRQLSAAEVTPTRITSKWKWLVAAQKVLAVAMSEDAGLDEDSKDVLLSNFQGAQLETQEVVSALDTELAESMRRVAARYAACLEDRQRLPSPDRTPDDTPLPPYPHSTSAHLGRDFSIPGTVGAITLSDVSDVHADGDAPDAPDLRSPALQAELGRAVRVLRGIGRRAAAWEAEVAGERWSSGLARLEASLRERLKEVLREPVERTKNVNGGVTGAMLDALELE